MNAFVSSLVLWVLLMGWAVAVARFLEPEGRDTCYDRVDVGGER